MRWLICTALLFAAVVLGGALAPEDEKRVRSLESSLLAPCCYREPVSRHQSEVAVRMRLEIATWVKEGKTDEEIIGIYKERYGARVFAPPAVIAWWVYIVPLVAVLAGLALIVQWLRRNLEPQGPNGITKEVHP